MSFHGNRLPAIHSDVHTKKAIKKSLILDQKRLYQIMHSKNFELFGKHPVAGMDDRIQCLIIIPCASLRPIPGGLLGGGSKLAGYTNPPTKHGQPTPEFSTAYTKNIYIYIYSGVRYLAESMCRRGGDYHNIKLRWEIYRLDIHMHITSLNWFVPPGNKGTMHYVNMENWFSG